MRDTDSFDPFIGIFLLALLSACASLVVIFSLFDRWANADIGLMGSLGVVAIASNTGFTVAFAGTLLWFPVSFLTLIYDRGYPGLLVWHSIELLIALIFGVLLFLTKMDQVMPWARHDVFVLFPVSFFGGLFFGWIARAAFKHYLFNYR